MVNKLQLFFALICIIGNTFLPCVYKENKLSIIKLSVSNKSIGNRTLYRCSNLYLKAQFELIPDAYFHPQVIMGSRVLNMVYDNNSNWCLMVYLQIGGRKKKDGNFIRALVIVL